MARLVFKDDGGEQRSVLLRPGLNRIGRGSYSDLFIDHASVSMVHCEVVVEAQGMTLRDLGSTNGTCVNGKRVRFAPLDIGDVLRVGSVEVAVREESVSVLIPEFREEARPPVLKTAAGKDTCLHHDTRAAVCRCTRCQSLLCAMCVHRIRRRGGATLCLCPDCSGPVEVLPEFAKPKKGSWFDSLKQKMKMTRLIPARKRKK
jgi:pSer/pThr/pTyr-binding forkhead associated (FHA) protein